MASRVKEENHLSWAIAEDEPLKKPLRTAIKSGTLEDVEKLLGPDSQPNLFYQETLDIALKTACNCKKKSVVEILLRSGARAKRSLDSLIDSCTKENNCIATEEKEIIKLLMEKSDTGHRRAVLSKVVSKGRSDLIDLLVTSKVGLNSKGSLSRALFVALRHGHIECIEILIRHGGKIDGERACEVALRGNTHETLKLFPQLYRQSFRNVKCSKRILYQVVSFGNIEFLKFMMESETNLINLMKNNDQLLIRTKNAETLQFLIDHGVVVHDSVKMCGHVLDFIRQEKLDMAKIFFYSGLNVNSENFKTGQKGNPLTEARNAETVQYLIDKGANVNERVSKSGMWGHIISTTALLEALPKEDEVLKVLLENGADPEVTDCKGHSALMIASQIPCGERKVEMLLKTGTQVNKLSECEETALSLATNRYDTTKSVKLLLQHGADVNITGPHKTALLNAVRNRNIETIQMLVESGINTKTLNTCDENGDTPLIMAVTLFQDDESCKCIDIFTAAGVDVNKQNDEGYTALMRAAEEKKHLSLKALIEAGADVNVSNSGETALSLAACEYLSLGPNPESVKMLLQNGADVNIIGSKTTSLLNALGYGSFETIQMLFESGINTQTLNTCNEMGDTPLIMAVRFFPDDLSCKFINLFTTAGADLNKQNDEGYTALMRAAQQKKHLSLKALIEAGADVNVSHSGKTALSLAASGYFTTKSVKMLLQNGADVNIIGSKTTALLTAIRARNFETIQMLFESRINTQTLNTCNEMGDTPLIMAVKFFPDDESSSKLINILTAAGADLNKRGDEGYTALMRAAQGNKYLTLKALINAGADLNANLEKNNSMVCAISILLSAYRHNRKSKLCIDELLNHGAQTCNVMSVAFKNLIERNVSWLIPKIIQHGFAPNEQYYISPLSIALQAGRDKIARYLLGNRFLTKSDILFEFDSFTCHPRCEELLTEITSQPFSLLTLSFVEVSSALGSGSDREKRVRKTGLPPMLQTKLLFKTEEVSLIVDYEEKNAVFESFDLSLFSSDRRDFSDYSSDDNSFRYGSYHYYSDDSSNSYCI